MDKKELYSVPAIEEIESTLALAGEELGGEATTGAPGGGGSTEGGW